MIEIVGCPEEFGGKITGGKRGKLWRICDDEDERHPKNGFKR